MRKSGTCVNSRGNNPSPWSGWMKKVRSDLMSLIDFFWQSSNNKIYMLSPCRRSLHDIHTNGAGRSNSSLRDKQGYWNSYSWWVLERKIGRKGLVYESYLERKWNVVWCLVFACQKVGSWRVLMLSHLNYLANSRFNLQRIEKIGNVTGPFLVPIMLKDEFSDFTFEAETKDLFQQSLNLFFLDFLI